jgi:hypothetical protein
MEKMTKKEMYALIAELCSDNADVVAFCDGEIAKLDAKAAKAKERAAEKRAAGDELYADVVATLTSEPQTANAIYEGHFASFEDLSVAKIRARLSQAVKNGVAVKETVKIDGKAKVVYSIAE